VDHHDLGRLRFRIYTRDGRVRWIEHTCRPVSTPDGRFLGRRGVNRDVTALCEAPSSVLGNATTL
jgi:PAS domain S-box-containing protein